MARDEGRCVYWDDEQDKRHARYVARWEWAPQFVPFVWALSCRCGWDQARPRALQGDGAAWVCDDVGAVLGTDDHGDVVHEVDWWHALQHVWAAGRALHGEGAAEPWVQTRETLLWEGRWRELRDGHGDLHLLIGEIQRQRNPRPLSTHDLLARVLGHGMLGVLGSQARYADGKGNEQHSLRIARG